MKPPLRLSSRAPISILIPTVGREQVLWNTLRNLLSQMENDDEIVMVDQNEPALILPEFPSEAPIRHLKLSPPSLTRARNTGLREAQNDRVLFLDDDIDPWPNLLGELARVSARFPECVITGLVEQEDRPAFPPPPLGALSGSIGFIDFRSGLICTDITRATNGETPFFSGGLFMLRKSFLPPKTEFCRWFRGAAQGEEIDFALRLRRAGIRFVSDTAIGIRHLKAPYGGCRSEGFKKKFFLDEIHNRALFYGLHGHWLHMGKFLARTRGFCEFHTRRLGGGHDWWLLLQAALNLKVGFILGACLRARWIWRPLKQLYALRGQAI